jgi:phospholipid/cholesterol/gamma-HCH transport system substrate-binding protein
METRANYVLLGGFAIVGAALIMLFALWLARAQWRQEFAFYDVVFVGAVRGLANGGEVRFNGIKVGEVEELFIDQDNTSRVIARVRVDSNTPVRTDSVGQLEQIGLTGVTLIQLSSGTPEAPLLRQGLGQPVPQIQGRPDPFNEILESGGDIATQVSASLVQIQELLTAENIERVSNILENLEAVSAELAAQREAIAAAGEAVVAVRDAGRSYDALAQDLRARLEQVDRILAQGEVTVTELNAAIADVRSLTAQVDAAVQTANVDTLPEVTRAARDLRRLTLTLDRLATSLQENPYGFALDRSQPRIEVAP